MRLVYSEHFDVYQHLAAEAYFLHEYDGDVLMIWRSHDAVVCGKHQNACGEANYRFCHQNKHPDRPPTYRVEARCFTI